MEIHVTLQFEKNPVWNLPTHGIHQYLRSHISSENKHLRKHLQLFIDTYKIQLYSMLSNFEVLHLIMLVVCPCLDFPINVWERQYYKYSTTWTKYM